MDSSPLNSNRTATVRSYTFFEFLTDTSTHNQTYEEHKILMLTVYAMIFTLTAVMAPTWRFLPRLAYLFTLLLSWIFGFCFKTFSPEYDSETAKMGISLILVNMAIPILVFHCTLQIDYHTLGRILGPVIFISCCLFFCNTALLSLIMYSINRVETTYISKLIHALNLSMLSVSDAISLLDKAQCQVRQLQILLQGEMLLSIALYRFLEDIIMQAVNVNQVRSPPLPGSTAIHAIWCLCGILPGILLSWVFRQYVSSNYDDCDGQGACSFSFCVILYCFCEIIGTDGTLSVLAFGICLGASKIKFSYKTARFYQSTHDFLHFMFCVIIFSYSGFIIGTSPNKFLYYDASFVLIIFFTCLGSRMITFVLIHRTVAKFNLQVNWKHLTVAVQGPSRGALLLAYTILYDLSLHLQEGIHWLTINVILICLSCIVNLSLMEPVLRAIGMFDLTRAKIVNMNLAVSQVNECRSRAVQALKVDRVIADANWIVVDQATQLQHPYKKNARSSLDENEEDFESKGQSRVVYCGECGVKGTAPLSTQEMEDVALDIKHRILKAQRVSFYRQNDNGTLSRHGVKILSNLVEKVLVRDQPILTARDLKIQRMGSPRMQCLKKVFRHLFTITSKKHVFIPTFWLRAFCFRLCTSRKYQITMACFSMIDLIFLFRFLHLYYSNASTYGAEVLLLQMLDFAFFFLFFLEFCIEVLGIGVVQYFNNTVNLVEFACSCLVRSLEIGMYIDSCVRNELCEDVFVFDPIIMYVKTLLVLRLTRIYVFIVALIPKILNLVDRKMDDDLMKIYDIGKAYLITQEQVMKFLGHLVANDEVYDSIVKILEADRLTVARELGLIKFDRTTIATTNKTGHAIRHVVNTMHDCISSMKEEESLDILETNALFNALERVKAKARNLALIEPLEPHYVISEIPWLKNDSQTVTFLLKHARISSYSANEIIINTGDDPLGLLLITEGLVKTSYVPTSKALNDNSKFGLLPNYDFFINLKFASPQDEYVTGCTVLGEIGIATGRPYDYKAVCETSVHLIWVPMKILRAVTQKSGNSLLYQSAIWKTVAIKIALNVLQDTPQFRGWSREKLFMYLQGGVVPVLDGVPSISINDHVQDTILIEGLAMDHATRMTYVAPYYIPRTVATLLLPDSPMMDKKTPYKTRLFVIPSPHADVEDISGTEGLFKDFMVQLERERLEKDLSTSSNSSRMINREKEECRRRHSRNKMSAYTRKLLKAQRRNLKAMRFVEYIPTAYGPIEHHFINTTYLMPADKKKPMGQAAYPKTKYYDPSFFYIADVAENSEIRELRGEDDENVEDKHMSKRSSQKRSRTISNLSDRSSSRITIDYDGSIARDKTELMFIESSEDEVEKLDSKEVQTYLRMDRTPVDKWDMHSISKVSLSSSRDHR